jgi:hypothetical protein
MTALGIPSRLHRFCLALTALLAGCSSGVDNPSAYETEQFLCAPEHADRWQADLERCRSDFVHDRSCGGISSFRGRLQGQPVTVDARLDTSAFEDLREADGARRRNELKLNGVAPYFGFRFHFREVGGEVPGAEERPLQLLSGARPAGAPEPLLDDFVRLSLRLSASSQSVATSATGGTMSVTLQRDAEEAAVFQLEFEGDVVDGCFHAFATEYNLIRSAPP